MSDIRVQQQGHRLGSLREMCEHYRIRQRANARLGSGIKPAAVEMMMSKIEFGFEPMEGSLWKK
jgi:hypothetical protein